MDNGFFELVGQTQMWVNQAVAAGWLSNKKSEDVSSLEVGDPAALFAEPEQRPLVVAFFGGTGVGKSSLLNRLAGQDIARTGVERPTSREISAFLHRSVQIAHLPSDFPTEKIKIANHDDGQKKNILWIDMPDIDSVEQTNRQIVLQWLPHVDVLIYILSPERYRDNEGWRLLLSHGHDHAWLFVMNQWDKGQEIQIEDLRKQIDKAGFQDPIVLRTDCLDNTPDDFDKLGEIIALLAEENTIKQLEQRGLRIRQDQLASTIEQCIEALGPDDAQQFLIVEWETRWEPTKQTIKAGLDWPLQQTAKACAITPSKVLRMNPKQEMDDSSADSKKNYLPFWDAWAQTRLEDALDGLLIKSDTMAIPVKPLKSRFRELGKKASAIIQSQAQQSLREALSNPGNRIQRFLLTCAKAASILLPLAAMIWVAYRLFGSYYQGSISDGEYLGINFAIHSALLIVTAWLLPWFLHRKLRPSTERVALKGLRDGLSLGLDLFADQVNQAIEETQENRLGFTQTGRHLVYQCHSSTVSDIKPSDEMLQRVLKRF